MLWLSGCDTGTKPSDQPDSSTLSSTYYDVGTRYFQWTNPDAIDPNYGGNRRVNIQVWFPIEPTKASRSTPLAPYYAYMRHIEGKLENWSEKRQKSFASR